MRQQGTELFSMSSSLLISLELPGDCDDESALFWSRGSESLGFPASTASSCTSPTIDNPSSSLSLSLSMYIYTNIYVSLQLNKGNNTLIDQNLQIGRHQTTIEAKPKTQVKSTEKGKECKSENPIQRNYSYKGKGKNLKFTIFAIWLGTLNIGNAYAFSKLANGAKILAKETISMSSIKIHKKKYYYFKIKIIKKRKKRKENGSWWLYGFSFFSGWDAWRDIIGNNLEIFSGSPMVIVSRPSLLRSSRENYRPKCVNTLKIRYKYDNI